MQQVKVPDQLSRLWMKGNRLDDSEGDEHQYDFGTSKIRVSVINNLKSFQVLCLAIT